MLVNKTFKPRITILQLIFLKFKPKIVQIDPGLKYNKPNKL